MIGAGVIGLAVALQLRRGGVPDVVVIDANDSPGMGSTARANGGVRAQFATAVNIEFSRYTIDVLESLDAAASGLVGLRRRGYLFMTGTVAGAASLHRAHALQRSLGVDVEWLDVADVAAHAPFVDVNGLRAATLCRSDGVIDPHGVATAMWSEASRLGATFVFGRRVYAIAPRGNGARVDIGNAGIDAWRVVNAAGPQAAALALLVGVELPVAPYRRNLACTEPIPGFPASTPMCVDMDTGTFIRGEGGAAIIGFSDPRDSPSQDTTFDPAFLEAVALRVGNRFPFLEGVPIDRRKCWAGLYPETPDHNAIIGATEEMPWLVQCAGFGGHGIMHSLAAGQAVTELIRDGRCTTFDLHDLRPDRFHGSTAAGETAVL